MRPDTAAATPGEQRRYVWSVGSAAVAVLALVALTVWQGINMTDLTDTATPEGERVIISVAEAHTRATAGELVVIDVRRPEEWRETGVGEPNVAITMHQPPEQFLAALDAIVGGDRSKPVAIICATGGRTGYLRPHLVAAGFTSLQDVSEGMMGSQVGAGWLRSGLPTRAPTQSELE